MTQFDWLIFGSMLFGLLVIAWWCRRHMRSVADFLIVGRKMRKYLGLSTGTAEGIGLVSIAFIAEQGFTNGFAYVWLALAAMGIWGCYRNRDWRGGKTTVNWSAWKISSAPPHGKAKQGLNRPWRNNYE